MLLLPAQAGVDGDKLVERPCVLSEQGVIVALGLEVQETELATRLAEGDAGTAIAATVEPGNEEFGRAAKTIIDTQLEGGICTVSDQLVLQVSIARQNGSRCCRI